VENAVEATIREWIGEYTAELRDQYGDLCPELPPIRSYGTRSEAQKWVDDQLPAVVIVSPGVDGEPLVSGDGWIEAPFRVGVIVFCSGQTEKDTRNRAQGYSAAIRGLLLQKTGLGGIATSTKWETEDFTPGPTEKGRTFGAAVVEFVFTIACVTNRRMGPTVHGSNATGPPVESTELIVHRDLETATWEG